jgi:hypothetical protein
MALDGGQFPFRPLVALALDQLRNRQPLELLGEAPGATLPVARQVKRRRLPEDPLDVAFLS